ncbi:hypothetical protein T02_535 [Trichinella nativa]|uniref:Uncharacterized protein n=1 Tax=Trichinella nativa TaxID=6335 RepID=A0A0V1LHV5_9BILA|nr:hypothetical protein T02_535 [Trichinella nativa]
MKPLILNYCTSANVPIWEDAKKPLRKGNLIRPLCRNIASSYLRLSLNSMIKPPELKGKRSKLALLQDVSDMLCETVVKISVQGHTLL